MLNIDAEVAAMRRMTVGQLRTKFAEVFSEETNGRNKDWLIKRIAWRMQANAEGDLTERARKRALEIANDADLRMMPPRPRKSAATMTHVLVEVKSHAKNRNLVPGTVLQRAYKGRNVSVHILEQGFVYEGTRYKSLTAAVKAITGKHWNGFHFFGLSKDGASS